MSYNRYLANILFEIIQIWNILIFQSYVSWLFAVGNVKYNAKPHVWLEREFFQICQAHLALGLRHNCNLSRRFTKLILERDACSFSFWYSTTAILLLKLLLIYFHSHLSTRAIYNRRSLLSLKEDVDTLLLILIYSKVYIGSLMMEALAKMREHEVILVIASYFSVLDHRCSVCDPAQ